MRGLDWAEAGDRVGKPPARSRRRRWAVGAAVVVVALLGVAEPAAAVRLLYVSNANTNNVSAFTIGSTGALTAVSGSPFATGGTFPQGLTVKQQVTPARTSPAVVYVANFSTNNVSAFTVGSGGRLTPVPGSPFATGQGPMTPVASAGGGQLYVANHTATPGSVSAFRIQSSGALAPIPGSPFSTGGSSPWGIAVSPNGVLYVPNENSGSVAVMRIGVDGELTHVSGSPFVVGQPADQLTDADVSIDGRFLFVTAGLGNNRGVWSFALRPLDGGLSSLTPITRAPTPIPVHVLAAPNNRHLYVTSRNDANFGEGAGGVSAFTIGSNGSLTRIFGASPTTTPFRTGGTTPFASDMLRVAPPRRLYVGNGDTNNVGAFSVSDSTGTLSSIAGSPFATRGARPNHFAVATTITDAAVVRRLGTGLRYVAVPGQANRLALSAGAIKAFVDEAISTTPAPSSGCMPITDRRVECFTSGVTEVRLFLDDRDDSLNANNGVPEVIECGTGFDSVFIDLTDPEPLFNTCERVSRFPVDTGSPATVVGRSARVRGGRAAVRLRCRRGREGGRCRGRLALRLPARRRAGRVIGRARYSIRAGRRETVRVPLRIRISGRRRVRLVARERARDGRPMTTEAVLFLRA